MISFKNRVSNFTREKLSQTKKKIIYFSEYLRSNLPSSRSDQEKYKKSHDTITSPYLYNPT